MEKLFASELSGNVIDLCPVGALLNKPYRYCFSLRIGVRVECSCGCRSIANNRHNSEIRFSFKVEVLQFHCSTVGASKNGKYRCYGCSRLKYCYFSSHWHAYALYSKALRGFFVLLRFGFFVQNSLNIHYLKL